MSNTLKFRLIIQRPLPDVSLKLQRGRDELVAPVSRSAQSVTFEFELVAHQQPEGHFVFRGAAAQGPPAKRFVYINSGQYAGQAGSPCATRAKVPLTGVPDAMVMEALARTNVVIAGEIEGRARNGGPAAATVPLLNGGWRIE